MDDRERKFVLERTYNSYGVNLYVFDEKDNLREYCQRKNPAWMEGAKPSGRADMPPERSAFLQMVREKCRECACPALFTETDGIYFAAFPDKESWLYVCGPIALEPLSFSALTAYRRRHRIENRKFRIPVHSLAETINAVELLYYMMTGNCVTEEEILAQSNFGVLEKANVSPEEVMRYEIASHTEEKRRFAYHEELRWTAEIENGTRMETKKLLQSENLEKLQMIGTLSNQNAFKQYEYMVISSTCLACRAAIRGGVDVYEAYSLADVFYQKVSMCSSVMELLQLYTEIADEFSSRVRRAKENRSSDVVEQCREYIARNRTKKFSLTALATELDKNPSYLSRVFSEQTGETLQEYALFLRLEAGANLLRYSDSSVGEIAEYLHFSSPSYFGEAFKRQFSRTPGEYRRQHKIRDFKE